MRSAMHYCFQLQLNCILLHQVPVVCDYDILHYDFEVTDGVTNDKLQIIIPDDNVAQVFFRISNVGSVYRLNVTQIVSNQVGQMLEYFASFG